MHQSWVVFALLSAFFIATSDAFTKKALARHDEYVVAWLRSLYAAPVLALVLLSMPAESLGKEFYTTAFVALPLEICAILLYVKALKHSPLSLSLPFLALTPLFLLVIPRMLLGETLTPAGTAGVVFIAAGSYLLNIGELRNGILAPFAAIGKERGSRYMIAVALIYGINSTLGKKMILSSSPILFLAIFQLLMTAALTPFALRGRGRPLIAAVRGGALKAIIVPGTALLLSNLCHVAAISMTHVAYMISVKRLSLLIGALYGHYLFRESGARERITAAAFMVAGFAMIVLG